MLPIFFSLLFDCDDVAVASILVLDSKFSFFILLSSFDVALTAAEGELCLHTKGLASEVVTVEEKHYLLNFDKKLNTAVNVSAGQMSVPLQLSAFESLSAEKSEHDCKDIRCICPAEEQDIVMYHRP